MHYSQTPQDTALTSLQQYYQHISSGFCALLAAAAIPCHARKHNHNCCLQTATSPLHELCSQSCVVDCSDNKRAQGRSSWWGRWGKKVAVGGAILGAGILVAAAARKSRK